MNDSKIDKVKPHPEIVYWNMHVVCINAWNLFPEASWKVLLFKFMYVLWEQDHKVEKVDCLSFGWKVHVIA